MSPREDLFDAVRAIYDSTVDALGWEDSLSAMLKPLDASRSFLVRRDLLSGDATVLADRGTEPAHITRHKAVSAAGLTPDWRTRLCQGELVRSSDMQADSVFAHSAFYDEAVRPTGDFYGLVAQIERNAWRDCFICVHRPHGAADFSADDVMSLRLMTYHLRTALHLEERLNGFNGHAASAQAALDQLDEGVLLLDARANPVFANRVGLTQLADEPALAVAIAALAARGRRELRNGGTFEVGRLAQPSLLVRIAPLARAGEVPWLPSHAVAAAFVSDPAVVGRRRAEALARTYGLTPAEVRVAMEITKGDGRIAVARRLQVTPATVQTHLSRIFEKTGTHRQAELIRLLFKTLPR